MKHILSVDMGGTKILGGVITAGGIILQGQQIATYPTPDTDPFEQLCHIISPLIDNRIAGISVGVPGVVPDDSGTVHIAPALSWEGFPLRKKLEERFSLPIKVENDVNLAALGEYRFGAGQGWRNMVCVAIGTGIGAGIVLDGNLYRGHMGAAGEIGSLLLGRHFLQHPANGNFGKLETIAGGAGMVQQAQTLGYQMSTAELFAAANTGEQWAITLVEEATAYLALMLANIMMILAPDGIVLSGSVILNNSKLLPKFQLMLVNHIPFVSPLRLSQLGAKATLLGGAANFLRDDRVK